MLGKGPAECCRVVACVQSLMMQQAKQQGVQIEVLENKAGELNGTLLSTTMMPNGHNVVAYGYAFLALSPKLIIQKNKSPYSYRNGLWYFDVLSKDCLISILCLG